MQAKSDILEQAEFQLGLAMRFAFMVLALMLSSCMSTKNKAAQDHLKTLFHNDVVAFTDVDGLDNSFTFHTTGDITGPSRYSTLFGDAFGAPGGWEIIDTGHMRITNARGVADGVLQQASIIPEKPYDSPLCELENSIAFSVKFNDAPYNREIFFTKQPQTVKKICLQQFAESHNKLIESIAKKYGKKYAPLIAEKRFAIGMTKEMVIASIGEPDSVNRTVTRYGVSEQWVYRHMYLYFDGDKLRSFQD